jgi:hypothetical protein
MKIKDKNFYVTLHGNNWPGISEKEIHICFADKKVIKELFSKDVCNLSLSKASVIPKL